MSRHWLRSLAVAFVLWLLASLILGWWVLPKLLMGVAQPPRTEAFRRQVLAAIQGPGDTVARSTLTGGGGRSLEVVHLRRSVSRGVVIYLHGFGDDAWGTLGRAASLPEWDAVGFTFRGRDLDPATPCTLGAWERADVVAVVHHLEASGLPRERILLAGWSMGAGVALLALEDLEREGRRLGGALLECPFEDLEHATRDHLRGTLGALEPLARLAERCAFVRAGRLAGFDPGTVSPVKASAHVETRIALVTGDADRETPVEGVRRIARAHPDLTVVPGAGHCEASQRLPGGWEGWARARLAAWGL